jgi:quercetin dioxygenase-like cupin family protein
MSHTKVNYEDTDTYHGMHFLRDPLNCENHGVTVADVEAGWSDAEHDHADDGQEEVYVLLDGKATVTVEGETVSLEPGDAVRIPAEATRQIETEEPSVIVLTGAA